MPESDIDDAARRLVDAGLLEAFGQVPERWYRLARPAAEISARDVAVAVLGPDGRVPPVTAAPGEPRRAGLSPASAARDDDVYGRSSPAVASGACEDRASCSPPSS